LPPFDPPNRSPPFDPPHLPAWDLPHHTPQQPPDMASVMSPLTVPSRVPTMIMDTTPSSDVDEEELTLCESPWLEENLPGPTDPPFRILSCRSQQELR
jgi:hypothetical protein